MELEFSDITARLVTPPEASRFVLFRGLHGMMYVGQMAAVSSHVGSLRVACGCRGNSFGRQATPEGEGGQ
jgi:hypothetical protein